MKGMFESEETAIAYATIDAAHYMIKELSERYNKSAPKSGIEAAIDKATGYYLVREKKFCEEFIPILEDLIEAKKVIDADCSKDEEALEETKKLLAK